MSQLHNTIISVNKLHKRFGRVQALNGLDLKVYSGDIYGFLGPNGSGKSTTIRSLLSLVKPDSGEVKVFGQELKNSRKKILPRIGALIERPNFYEHLSALTNLKLLLKYGGVVLSENEILENLDLVGLEKRATDKIRTFSDGMKQRLGIAQAIIHQPELLILDEPFNGLDPQGVKDIRDLILKLNHEKGITVLISSHNLDEVEKLVSRLILIHKGKALVEGTIDELIKDGKRIIKLKTDQPEKAMTIIKQSDLEVGQLEVREAYIYFSANLETLSQINSLLVKNKIKVYQLGQDQTLESFFLSFMQSQ